MTIGRFVSDLEEGDILESVVYVLSPFMVREYCRGAGEHAESFHGPSVDGSEPQQVPPTLIHIDKFRLLDRTCPGGPGPNARIHYEYHATHHRPVPIGEQLRASGRVARRYERRGRQYLEIEIDLRVHATGELLTTYRDTALLAYKITGPTQ